MLKHTSFFIGSFALVVAITLGASQSANPTATPTAPQSDTQDSSQKSAKPKRGPGLRYGIADAPKKTKAIRLAAYNIQNFFDRVDDPKLSGEWDDMKLAITDDRAEALAKVIHQLDADVLFLEEVESKEALMENIDKIIGGSTFFPRNRQKNEIVKVKPEFEKKPIATYPHKNDRNNRSKIHKNDKKPKFISKKDAPDVHPSYLSKLNTRIEQSKKKFEGEIFEI